MDTITMKNSVTGILDGLIGNIFSSGEVRAPSQDDIREKAYLLWEEAGRPDGDGVEFWLKAETELADPQTLAASRP